MVGLKKGHCNVGSVELDVDPPLLHNVSLLNKFIGVTYSNK